MPVFFFLFFFLSLLFNLRRRHEEMAKEEWMLTQQSIILSERFSLQPELHASHAMGVTAMQIRVYYGDWFRLAATQGHYVTCHPFAQTLAWADILCPAASIDTVAFAGMACNAFAGRRLSLVATKGCCRCSRRRCRWHLNGRDAFATTMKIALAFECITNAPANFPKPSDCRQTTLRKLLSDVESKEKNYPFLEAHQAKYLYFVHFPWKWTCAAAWYGCVVCNLRPLSICWQLGFDISICQHSVALNTRNIHSDAEIYERRHVRPVGIFKWA